jgi:hypothetical protein
MRCPNCEKFVSFDDPQVEVEDTDVNGEQLTGIVRVVLTCNECGDELKDYEFDLEADIEHECEKMPEGEEPSYEIESEWDGSSTDRFETTVQRGKNRGKAIRNYRYMRHYYGAELTASVKCSHCGEVIEVEITCEEQASGFNELV